MRRAKNERKRGGKGMDGRGWRDEEMGRSGQENGNKGGTKGVDEGSRDGEIRNYERRRGGKEKEVPTLLRGDKVSTK